MESVIINIRKTRNVPEIKILKFQAVPKLKNTIFQAPTKEAEKLVCKLKLQKMTIMIQMVSNHRPNSLPTPWRSPVEAKTPRIISRHILKTRRTISKTGDPKAT